MWRLWGRGGQPGTQGGIPRGVGLDGGWGPRADVDVVLLTTPPGFRPEYFEKCVKAGKHTFVEKPIAVDAPGYRRFMESARLSKEKGLGVQSGFCWRSHYLERETYKRVL